MVAWTAERRAPAAPTPPRAGQPPGLGELVTTPGFAGCLVASSGSDLAPWRRTGRWAGPAPAPARHAPGGTGSGRRRRHRCSRPPPPADRRVGRRAPAPAGPGRVAGTVSCSTSARWRRPGPPRWGCPCGGRPRRASSTRSASRGIALTPCRTSTWTGLVRTDPGQDGDGTHPTSLGWSSSSIRPAAPVPGRSRQRRADKSAA